MPNAPTTTIGAIRSKLVPANQAAQFLTRDFADSTYVALASTQTITGVKTFSNSPAVPTPQNPTDAANKAYVDATAGSGNLAAPPPIGNVTPNTVNATVSTAQDARTANFPVMDLRDYGLVGDGTRLQNCAITSGQRIVTCIGSAFSSADVGKGLFFAGAGASSAYLNSSIASYQSPTQVTLAAAASTTVSGGTLWYGTDNTAAWCAAMTCTNVNSPNAVYSPQPGRTVRLPRGTYLLTGSAYTRNGDQLIGDGYTGTEVMLFDPTGNIHLLYMGSNASAGVNTGTLDSGGLGNRVSGIMFAAPESGNICLDTNGSSGWDIDHDWFQCPTGILVNNSNIGRVTENTCDASPECMVVKGSGADYSADVTHSVLISNNLCYAPRYACVQFDGASGVNFVNNVLDYAGQYSIYFFSAAGNTSYRINIADNIFTTSLSSDYYTATQQHIAVLGPLARSTIGPNNLFSNSRDADIFINGAVSHVDIFGNKFYGGQLACGSGQCTASLEIPSAGTDISVHDNRWFGPGAYAGDFQNPIDLTHNYCNSPFSVAPLPTNDYDKACFRFASSADTGLIARANWTDATTVAAVAIRGGATAASTSENRSAWATADVYFNVANGSFDSWDERIFNGDLIYGMFPTRLDPSTGNAVLGGSLTYQTIPGVQFLVSHYASIQAAINAAYNNGNVIGTVIDDRTSPYTGPGFILYDSVTLKLAATTYTINSTVPTTTATIPSLRESSLCPARALSAPAPPPITAPSSPLPMPSMPTSSPLPPSAPASVPRPNGGIGEASRDLRVTGNGANQTAGNCFNIENMGETAFLRTIEVSGCYLDNILFTGASATPSDIANITTNSAGRYGFNFNNLSGVAVVHGLSGDSNTTSIVRLNGGQSGTLTILGFKTEEEISGQDPLITIDQTGQSGAQPSLYIVGGYTFGRSGVNDVIKYVNGTAGTTPYISVNNFYVQNYVNAVNDVVNSRTTAATNMNKVPFYYGPTGGFLSGQAFTLDLNTFIQSPHSGNGILTEVFGTTSSNETIVAASGTSTSLSVGGIGFRMPNRTTYGQSPELFAKMTYAFPGGIPNTQQWEFIPAKVGGDNSTRWIGDPGYRWDEIYSADINTTTATVGALNVTTCTGCGTGTRLVSGTMQGATATLTGNSADQTIYTATLPAGTFTVGGGAHCYAKWTHPTASGSHHLQVDLGYHNVGLRRLHLVEPEPRI